MPDEGFPFDQAFFSIYLIYITRQSWPLILKMGDVYIMQDFEGIYRIAGKVLAFIYRLLRLLLH
jgi:hypothetical protein